MANTILTGVKLVDMHIEAHPKMSVAAAHTVAQRVKEHLHRAKISIVDALVYIALAPARSGAPRPG